jgi:hypothetical protein
LYDVAAHKALHRMTVNIRKGLFRLWVVGSILFVVCVFGVSYTSLREEFRIANTNYDAIAKDLGGYSLLPTDCAKARGTAASDYSEAQNLCWYKIEDFRRLYPEYKDVSDKALSEKLYEKAGQPLKHVHPWESVGKIAGVAFGIPLVALLVGWSLLWAFSGFRSA